MIKKVAVICFTENGSRIAEKVKKCLCKYEKIVIVAKKYKSASDSIRESLDDWTSREFKAQDALVYIGAAGIAVRAVAPYVKSKIKDPAVLVIDEQGHYCIPLLSGHIGGANELARLISKELKAIPVITTATDLNRKWAVDVFAEKNGLKIQDMEKAKAISAKILLGEVISMYIDKSCDMIQGKMPKEVRQWSEKADEGHDKGRQPEVRNLDDKALREPEIAVGIYKNPQWKETLYLIPETVVLGIGCRKGKERERIEKKMLQLLDNNGIFLESVSKVSSLELKRNEAGILGLCEKYGWEFETFSAEILEAAEGEFAGSGFVKRITGVDNICERSAVCGSEGGTVIIEKHAEDGITIAAAERKWGVRFE